MDDDRVSKEVKDRADRTADKVAGEVRDAVEGAEQDVRDADRREQLDRITDEASGKAAERLTR